MSAENAGKSSAGTDTQTLIAELQSSGAVSRGLIQTLAFAEELTQRNEELEKILVGVADGDVEGRVAVLKALEQNTALIKKLYTHVGDSCEAPLEQ